MWYRRGGRAAFTFDYLDVFVVGEVLNPGVVALHARAGVVVDSLDLKVERLGPPDLALRELIDKLLVVIN